MKIPARGNAGILGSIDLRSHQIRKPAVSLTKNIPVKANTDAGEQKRMFEAAIHDISKKFRPDLIIVSAGFDAHLTDPLGQLRFEDDDFVSMTRTLMQWADDACGGRIVSCLEGGYNLETLGLTVKNHVAELSR